MRHAAKQIPELDGCFGEGTQVVDLQAARSFADGPKRWFDVGLAAVLLALALPLLLLIAVPSWASGRPAFYGHPRVGRGGTEFKCWKLRSMVVEGDAVLRAHLAVHPHAAREWGETRKLRADPRVTRLGRFLRRSSLDEVPQLWNVLCGEMSLVGPRPVTAAEAARTQGFDWVYASVRPGLTGLWQVHGRAGAPYARRVPLDARYVARLGFAQDLWILLRTVGVVLRGTGY